MKRLLFNILLVLSAILRLSAQDSIPSSETDLINKYTTSVSNPYKFRPLQLAVPAALIGVGFVGLESDWLKHQNTETRDELTEHPHSKLTVDDFTQFAPLTACYGLRLCGVKGLHDYKDMTIITGTAYLLTGISSNRLRESSARTAAAATHFPRATQPRRLPAQNCYAGSIGTSPHG